MKPRKLLRRWQRRRALLLGELESLLPRCRRRGGVEQVHELRVVLRRLRLFVRVGQPLLDREVIGAFRAWARRISRATSPVRDLDVAMEWLASQPDGLEVIPALKARRQGLWASAQTHLPPPVPGLLSRLAAQTERGDSARRLSRRIRKLERRLANQVRDAVPCFFALPAEEQHEFRRTLRWWRYLRELSLPRRRQRKDGFLKALVALQEATGDRQNIKLAAAALSRLGDSPAVQAHRRQARAAERAQLDRIHDALAAFAKNRGWKVTASTLRGRHAGPR